MGCKKKKEEANDQGVANVEKVADVHVQEVAGELLHQALALHFCADNLYIRAFQELTCIYVSKIPNKKTEIIQRLATKYRLKNNLPENRGRPHTKLNDEEKIWLTELLDRSNITYTNSERKKHIHIGKLDRESKYKPKQYLL